MKNQLSHIGKGMLLTLLMLGFSHKGTYGKIPVNFKETIGHIRDALSSELKGVQYPFKNRTNSFFVRRDDTSSGALIILVSHDMQVAQTFRKIVGTQQTPLIFSISTLPSDEAHFNPLNLQFEQDEEFWQPGINPLGYEMFPLHEYSKFGGNLLDDEVHQGIILLPEWFDMNRPIRIHYLNNHRLLSFR